MLNKTEIQSKDKNYFIIFKKATNTHQKSSTYFVIRMSTIISIYLQTSEVIQV